MIKPAVLVVDDDQEVLRAVGRDLRREYGGYRVLQADSADAGFEALRQLKRRGEHLALFVVDQRMPRVTGVEFLEKAIGLFRQRRNILVTRRHVDSHRRMCLGWLCSPSSASFLFFSGSTRKPGQAISRQ